MQSIVVLAEDNEIPIAMFYLCTLVLRQSRQQQEMSTGGCGISLDLDSVFKEFRSCVVLGKMCGNK